MRGQAGTTCPAARSESQGCSMMRYLTALLAVLIPATLPAAEVTGKVSKVGQRTITIQIPFRQSADPLKLLVPSRDITA